MNEWRVTNGVQESLFIGTKKELEAYIDHFFSLHGGVVDVRPVTDFSVKEMPKTLHQREEDIPDKFWNFCHKCRLQFRTYHTATHCLRCPSTNLERRVYHASKNSNKREA